MIVPTFLVAPLLALAAAAGAQPSIPERFDDMFGAWSPDGRRIAFTSDRTGDPEIFVAVADGTRPVRLTERPGRDAHPAWSPDGATIAFQSPREGGHTRLHTMRADGSSERVLARTSGFCDVPAWSPDGRRIAFQCSDDPDEPGRAEAPWRLFVVAADGSGLRQVTQGPGNDQVPSWFPDGESLLFHSDRSGTDQLYRLDLASGRVEALTAGPDAHHSASISADGTRIALMKAPPGEAGDVHVLDRRDGRFTRITFDGPRYGAAVFSPDGSSLLFQAPTPQGMRLHVIASEGGGPAQLVEFGPGSEPD